MFEKFTIFLKQSFPKSLIIYCYIQSQIVICKLCITIFKYEFLVSCLQF